MKLLKIKPIPGNFIAFKYEDGMTLPDIMNKLRFDFITLRVDGEDKKYLDLPNTGMVEHGEYVIIHKLGPDEYTDWRICAKSEFEAEYEVIREITDEDA